MLRGISVAKLLPSQPGGFSAPRGAPRPDPAPPSSLALLPRRMTVKLGESSGEEGVKKLGKRAGGDEESLEEEGAGGGGEAAPGSSSTKKEEKIINSSTTSSPPPNPNLSPAPASLQPSQSQDQHHFLRSSVRPQSKRLKKDSQASSSVGSSTAGKGKGTVFGHPKTRRQGRGGTCGAVGCHSVSVDAIFCLVWKGVLGLVSHG